MSNSSDHETLPEIPGYVREKPLEKGEQIKANRILVGILLIAAAATVAIFYGLKFVISGA